MDAPEGPQVRAERRTRPLAGVAMDLAVAITSVVSRPFVPTVANRGMGRRAAPIALPFVGIQPGAAGGHVFGAQVSAGAHVRMVAAPQARLARLTRDHADDGGTIGGIGAVPFALIGTPAGRIAGGAMGRAFFPRVVVQLVRLTGGTHHHVGGRRGVQMGLEALPQGVELWARPWHCHAAGARGWPAVAESWQKRSRCAACRNPRTPDSGRMGKALDHGTSTARGGRTGGI